MPYQVQIVEIEVTNERIGSPADIRFLFVPRAGLWLSVSPSGTVQVSTIEEFADPSEGRILGTGTLPSEIIKLALKYHVVQMQLQEAIPEFSTLLNFDTAPDQS